MSSRCIGLTTRHTNCKMKAKPNSDVCRYHSGFSQINTTTTNSIANPGVLDLSCLQSHFDFLTEYDINLIRLLLEESVFDMRLVIKKLNKRVVNINKDKLINKLKDKESDCFICLETKKTCKILNCCEQTTCECCLNNWFKVSSSCPHCRACPVLLFFNNY